MQLVVHGGKQVFLAVILDITERKKSEAELEKLHKQLLDASRQAGMAEVATGVLHNVGNVLRQHQRLLHSGFRNGAKVQSCQSEPSRGVAARTRRGLRFYRDTTAKLPDDVTLMGGVLHAPDGSGTKLAAILAAHFGPLPAGEAALRPIKQFGTPLMDAIGPSTYEATNTMLDAGFPRGALNYWKATFLTELSDAAIDAIIDGFRACPSPMSGVVLEHFHGAVTRVGATETAYPHRATADNLVIAGEWLDPADGARTIAWVRQMFDAMKPYAARSRYVNYLAADEAGDPLEGAYGPNLPRLRAIKARYDPDNLFHLNQNIRPA